MDKDVDLTYSKDQRKQDLKEVVTADGTIRKVPLKEWVRTIIKDPNGPTALRAKTSKDPDLEKIRIPTIQRGGFTKPSNVDPVKVLDPVLRARRRADQQTDLTYGLDPETAKRRGFILAEEGKFGGRNNKKTAPKEDKSDK